MKAHYSRSVSKLKLFLLILSILSFANKSGAQTTCNAHFLHYSLTSNSDSIHFYPNSMHGTHYYWTFGDGTNSTNQDPWHLYSTPGNYLACLVITDSLGATCDFCDSVHVGIPPPVCNAHFSHYSLTSNPDSVHFYPATTGAAHYYWTFGDGTNSTNQDPWHLYAQPGNYLACLVVTTSTGATCDFCDSVHVGIPPPVCNAHFSHYSLTSNPDSVHFYPASTGAAHYYWTFGDGTNSTNQDPWHLYAQPGNYLACLVVTTSTGATCDFCDSVHVGIPPPVCNAHFSHYSLTSNPDSVHFYPATTGAAHYYWTFGDGTNSTNQDPWHLYAQPGNYLACLVVTTSTGATCDFCDSVHVGIQPPVCNAHFSHYSLTSNPDSVHFYPATTGATHYYWTFGDGTNSTNQDPWHLYAQPGNYLACLVVTTSTGATCDFCDSVHVGIPPPVCNAHFSHYSLTSNPDSVHFYPATTGAAHYYWTFGDGTNSTNQDPWHLYAQPGNYLACLVVTTSTGATCDFCDSVHVGIPPPVCNAHFSHYFMNNPDSIHFYPASTGAAHYYWTFGDGTNSTNQYPWHLYSQPGNYLACLVVTTSTGATCDFCDSVHVGIQPPVCNAHFSHYSLTSNPDSVHFYPATTGATHYYWTFGDGTNSTNQDPWHLYAQPGNYLACLVVTTSTGATCDFCDSVHVGIPPPVCNAHFSHYFMNNPDSIHFYPASTGAAHYYWTFGDGTNSTNQAPWHLYAQPGNYLACLVVTTSTGATCDFCDSVHVGIQPPVCNAHFNHYFISNPDSIHFYPLATGPVHYHWDFDDGIISTLHDPWHLFVQPGTYHVCLIVTDTITGLSCDWCDNIVITSFHSGSSVMINPNPVTREAFVSLINIPDPVSIIIFDISGRIVYNKENLTDSTFNISTEGFLDGIYYYTVRNSSNIVSEGKMIIIH